MLPYWSRSSTSSRYRGFTLIELLVVVALIALLVSMLLPVLSMARHAAQGVQCQSNQRQMSIFMNVYLEDYRGMWPGYWGSASSGEQWNFWNDRMAHLYLSNALDVPVPVMGCPAAEATFRNREAGAGKALWVQFSTYANRGRRGVGGTSQNRSPLIGDNYYNVWDLDETTFWDRSGGVPSDYWILGDSAQVTESTGVPRLERQYFTITTHTPANGSYSGGAFAMRHLGSGNIAFADGHVEAWAARDRTRIPVRQVVDPQQPTQLRDVPLN